MLSMPGVSAVGNSLDLSAQKEGWGGEILLSPPTAQDLQSAVHAEHSIAASVHAGASKAAVQNSLWEKKAAHL